MSTIYNKAAFMNRSRLLYGNKFNYPFTELNKSYDIITLYCNDCNEDFDIIAYRHFKIKYGCPLCSRKKTLTKNKLSTLNFIHECNIVHNNKYLYDLISVDVLKYKSYIEIYCLSCQNTFKQRVDSHLYGSGCPHCNINLHKKL